MELIKDQKLIKVGNHIDANGQETTLTHSDLQELVDTYNPEDHEAFIVVGHTGDPLMGECPHDRCPSFGWVKKPKVSGDFLIADLEVVAQLKEWLEAKLYKFKSLAFYPKELDINPNPGKLTIRHLAILGGAPPAIKGLGSLLNFNEKGIDIMTTKVTLNKEEEMETDISTNKEPKVSKLREVDKEDNGVIPEPLGAFEEKEDEELVEAKEIEFSEAEIKEFSQSEYMYKKYMDKNGKGKYKKYKNPYYNRTKDYTKDRTSSDMVKQYKEIEAFKEDQYLYKRMEKGGKPYYEKVANPYYNAKKYPGDPLHGYEEDIPNEMETADQLETPPIDEVTPFNPEPELSAEELSTLNDEDADLATLSEEEGTEGEAVAEEPVELMEDETSDEGDFPESLEGIDEFLDENVEELYKFILSDGPRGYKGEISRFVPEPSEDNSFLFDTETAVISGVFIDESSNSLDEFEFEIKRSGDGWVSTHKPVQGDPEPELDEAEIEDELADDPETNDQVSEFGEGCGCDKNPLQLTNVANGGLDMPPVVRTMSHEEKTMQHQIDALSAKLAALEMSMMKDLMGAAYAENRILPSQLNEDVLKGFAEKLSSVGSAKLFSFSETHQNVSLLEMFTEIIRSLPPQVEMGEVETSPVENSVDSQAIVGYSEFANSTPEDGEATKLAVLAYCEKNDLNAKNHRDYIKALKAVTIEAEG